MKSYLSLIPISAKVHRRQNRMTLLCIVFAVFMVTAVFSMAEMGFRMEQARLVGKHGSFSIGDLLGSSMGQTLLSVAVVLFLLILIAGVLMISSSMNSHVKSFPDFLRSRTWFSRNARSGAPMSDAPHVHAPLAFAPCSVMRSGNFVIFPRRCALL